MDAQSESGDENYVLRKLIKQFASVHHGNSHRWIWEGERWNELVFALLTRCTILSEPMVRTVTNHMSELQLLDIEELSSLADDGQVDFSKTLSRNCIAALCEGGFSRDEAQKGVTTLCQAAYALKHRFGAKVQRYLRRYGELMLQESGTIFTFTALNTAEVRYAFTYWLQNVLNMPVSLADERLQQFAIQNRTSVEKLISAADSLDVNLAALDDLVLSATSELNARDKYEPSQKTAQSA